jgi:hypothetical protein
VSDFLLGQPDLSPGLSGVSPEDAAAGGEPSGVARWLGLGGPDPAAHLAKVFDAARLSDEVNSGASARLIANQEAAEDRNARIQAATGVQLENPFHRPPLTGTEIDDPYAAPLDRDALKAYAAAHADYTPGQIPPAAAQDEIDALRVQSWRSSLAALQRDNPDKAAIIGADRPIEGDAVALANRRAAEASAAYGQGGLAPFLASLAGGLVAARRDPVQVAGLFAGPVEGAGLKVADLLGNGILGRIVGKGVGQALTNAGLEVAEQPSTQSWRAQTGQQTGILPAMQDVGYAALFGFVPGAGHAALGELWRAATAGSREAAAALADKLPKGAAPELEAALASDAADRAAPEPPAGVKAAAAAQSYRDAVRAGEDPSEPLPEPAPVAPEGVTDGAAARALAETNGDPFEAVEALRRDPSLVESALASDRPDLAQAGRLASLSDDAWERVRLGEVDPTDAAHVGALIADPQEHGAALDELAHFRPADEDAARAIVSDFARVRAFPDASQALLGDPSPVIARELPIAAPHETPAERAAHVAALTEAFKGEAAGEAEAPASKAAPRKQKAPPKPEVDHEAAALDQRDRYPGDEGAYYGDGPGTEGDAGAPQEPLRSPREAGGQSETGARPERLIDAVPHGLREDGGDYQPRARDDVLAETPLENKLAAIIRNCPL